MAMNCHAKRWKKMDYEKFKNKIISDKFHFEVEQESIEKEDNRTWIEIETLKEHDEKMHKLMGFDINDLLSDDYGE